MCTHSDRGKTEKGQGLEYFLKIGKNTIFNEHLVVDNQKGKNKSWVKMQFLAVKSIFVVDTELVTIDG